MKARRTINDLRKLLPFLLAAALAGTMIFYATAYLNWDRYGSIYPFAAAAAVTFFTAFAFAALWAAGARRAKLALHSLAAVGVFCGLLFGVSFIFNNLLGSFANGPRLAIFASFSLCGLLVTWLLTRAIAPDWQPCWRRFAAGAAVLAVLVTTCIVQYLDVRLPLLQPVFSSPDLIQHAERIPSTNEFQLAEASAFNIALIVEKGSAEKYTYWNTAFRKDSETRFRLEAFVDGDWRMVHRGEKIQTLRLCSFDAVTTDRVRVVAESLEGEPVLIQSLALYNEPKRKKPPNFHATAYFALDPREAEIPPEVAILAQGEEYARNYARWFDIYDTVIVIGGIRPDPENGRMEFFEGEERYTQRLNALKELIALRSDPTHEVKLSCTVFLGGVAECDPILRDHMDALLEVVLEHVEKFGFDGADVDYELPFSRAEWRRYDAFMARLDDGMKETNPDAILSAAVMSWGMGMSRETLERLDQILYMDYCGASNEHGMPALEDMQRGVAEIVRAGADPKKVLIGLGTFGCGRNEQWLDMQDANYWDCIYPGDRVGNSPALAGDAVAYALLSGAGGVMVFTAMSDKTMDDPNCMARGIEDAMGRYMTAW